MALYVPCLLLYLQVNESSTSQFSYDAVKDYKDPKELLTHAETVRFLKRLVSVFGSQAYETLKMPASVSKQILTICLEYVEYLERCYFTFLKVLHFESSYAATFAVLLAAVIH